MVEIPSGAQDRINNVSIGSSAIVANGDAVSSINNAGFSLLTTAKLAIQGLIMIYIVYVGIQMIISMGSDEEELGKSKRQLRYALIGFAFINLPGSIYQAFHKSDINTRIDGRIGQDSFVSGNNDTNIFIDFFNFGYTFNEQILGFIKVFLFGIAVFMLILAGIKLITAASKEDKLSEAKNKIQYSILALVFVTFIETWKNVAFQGELRDGVSIFETLSNLALFFAGPTAIFFLTLAGYYYITSNGDEEKVKKAKNIVLNTVLATLILLASYTFLLDLATL
ncbi:MAG: hypothetical protein H6767_06185 [Candidatus Peribacteria bacterium]|nr:MAG: hypothetical protein H6767_06185 [Candidatus Peribacteria bacterium]